MGNLADLATEDNFNPRSPRGGATATADFFPVQAWISIHAPHEGERRMHVSQDWAKALISIHAPHEGERRCIHSLLSITVSYFNPRSPRGGATRVPARGAAALGISIHAPHEGERRA